MKFGFERRWENDVLVVWVLAGNLTQLLDDEDLIMDSCLKSLNQSWIYATTDALAAQSVKHAVSE
jgi:hypothetical protein